MTTAEIREAVERIRVMRYDNETAHVQEDDLWCKVLKDIAAGGYHAKAKAQAALSTRDVDFERWYA